MKARFSRSRMERICDAYLMARGIDPKTKEMLPTALKYEDGKTMVVPFDEVFLESPVTVICYDDVEKFDRRKDAIDKYYEGMLVCEGCEAERYMNVFCDLTQGRMVATDHQSRIEGVE